MFYGPESTGDIIQAIGLGLLQMTNRNILGGPEHQQSMKDPIQTMSGSEMDTSGVLIRRVTAVERFQFSDLPLDVFVEFLKVIVRKQHS